jgi:hypothetical protein
VAGRVRPHGRFTDLGNVVAGDLADEAVGYALMVWQADVFATPAWVSGGLVSGC